LIRNIEMKTLFITACISLILLAIFTQGCSSPRIHKNGPEHLPWKDVITELNEI